MSSETCVKCGVAVGQVHLSTCRFSHMIFWPEKGNNPNAYQIGGDHYKEMAVQPWAAMESWMTPEEFAGFLRGNVIKYVARAGKKGDEVQDLKKALHYLEKLVSVKEQEK